MVLPCKPITVIAGHYGSGKTEFAINLAFALAAEHQVTLVDLDIVNPYFCSREQAETLKKANISLIAPAKSCHHADVPALPAEVARIFVDQQGYSIVDVGGDDAGAQVLGRYRPQFDAVNYNFWMVLNANRPQTATLKQALDQLRRIEAASGRKFTGIINNTHLCGMTGPEDVLRGAALAKETANRAGLSVICHLATEAVFATIPESALLGERFPIEINMKKPWE